MTTVFDGIEIAGRQNVEDAVVLCHVRSAIRRGHEQVAPTAVNGNRVCIVGGGPSLEATFPALRQLVFEGAKLVTVNGSYRWCLDRNLRPSAQIVLDARPGNARFFDPDVPQCRYYLCSQCAPESWDAVEGREFVGIWHDASSEAVTTELDAYYLKRWYGVSGGTTVGTRAIGLLRMLGYLRFDLFGFDSCWMGDQHHAYPQSDNDADARRTLTIAPTGAPHLARTFDVSIWHVKQLEDLLLMIRTSGDKFVLNIHGDGLLAYALQSSAQVEWSVSEGANHGNWTVDPV